MARQRIKWSTTAKLELKEILDYWNKHNQSTTYSKKLLKLFKAENALLAKFPHIGTKTDLPNVRQRIVRDYLLFYEVTKSQIKILSVWDGRQNPKEKPIK